MRKKRPERVAAVGGQRRRIVAKATAGHRNRETSNNAYGVVHFNGTRSVSVLPQIFLYNSLQKKDLPKKVLFVMFIDPLQA